MGAVEHDPGVVHASNLDGMVAYTRDAEALDRILKLTMMPMEIGAGFASFASFILSVVVPSHASVSVVSAASAVGPATIAVRAMMRQQVRSIGETQPVFSPALTYRTVGMPA
jgi:hypothetical protein